MEKFRVKSNAKYCAGQIGKVKETKSKENVMFYPDNESIYRIVISKEDIEKIS